MDAEIINIGSEILIGDTINNSQQFIASELANIDINVYCSNTAGFDPMRLRELLSIALTRSDIILLIGGMGPNLEDITKQTVCEALGLTLVPHEISRARIQEYCANNGIMLTDTIMSMADMPAGSVVFKNENGMCPGCAIRSSKQCIVMLPSSTVEMMPMIKKYVVQYLKQLTDGAVFSQVINIFSLNLTLHDVEEKLGNLLSSTNPTVKCIEMTGEVRIRVTAKTSTEQISRETAAPVIRQILQIFGNDAYGMNVSGIEEIVVRELKERKMTLSTAESCTAGIISKRVTDIPGSSRVFEMGAATYSSNKKSDMLGVSEKIIQRYGAVSPEAAAAMAVGARRLAGSTLAVSTTGIAGPGGGTPLKPVGLVYIALADKENVWIRKTLIQKPGMDRDYVRQVAATTALNLVRMYINSLPYLMPGYEPLGEGVRESYFDESTVLSPQAVKLAASSVPVASLGMSQGNAVQPSMPANALPPAAQNRQRSASNMPMPAGNQTRAPQQMPQNAKGQKKTKATASDIVQRVLFYISLVVMLCCGSYLLYNLVIMPHLAESNFDDFRESHETVEVSTSVNGIWSTASASDAPAVIERMEDGTLKSFESLLKLNKDIIGWITVPSTVIDYPVVQYPDDVAYNEKHGEYYYLHRDISGEYDKNGTIFAYHDCQFDVGTVSRNTILFGHHMRSGIMFANLLKYDVYKSGGLSFYKQNPVIRFDTKYDEGEWVIFSVMKLNTLTKHGEPFLFIRSTFENDQDFENYIAQVRARSIIDTYSCIDVNSTDELLTLSTCSYEYDEFRTVIVARRIRDNETSIDVSSASVATDPVMPDVWNR